MCKHTIPIVELWKNWLSSNSKCFTFTINGLNLFSHGIPKSTNSSYSSEDISAWKLASQADNGHSNCLKCTYRFIDNHDQVIAWNVCTGLLIIMIKLTCILQMKTNNLFLVTPAIAVKQQPGQSPLLDYENENNWKLKCPILNSA